MQRFEVLEMESYIDWLAGWLMDVRFILHELQFKGN